MLGSEYELRNELRRLADTVNLMEYRIGELRRRIDALEEEVEALRYDR